MAIKTTTKMLFDLEKSLTAAGVEAYIWIYDTVGVGPSAIIATATDRYGVSYVLGFSPTSKDYVSVVEPSKILQELAG